MDYNQIKNSVENIEVPESIRAGRISPEYIQRGQSKLRKRRIGSFTKNLVIIAVVSTMIYGGIIDDSLDYHIIVYAATEEGGKEQVVLSENTTGEILLYPEHTDIGYGYVIKVDIPTNYTFRGYFTSSGRSSLMVQQKDNSIYWIPAQMYNENIFDEDMNHMELDLIEDDEDLMDGIDTGSFIVEVKDDQGVVVSEIHIGFTVAEGECVIEILDLNIS